ncbi:DUF6456 domain-containing protein, partial [Albidovulum sp.]
MTVQGEIPAAYPAWLPENARLYLIHVEEGRSLREIARAEGCHPSTILRRIRAFENRRDDPLIDEALTRLGGLLHPCPPVARAQTLPDHAKEESRSMTAPQRSAARIASDATVEREARRILRRLCEVGAVLVVAPELDKAVVMKGEVRTAVVDRATAQAFALKDWIAARQTGRIMLYEITAAGRAALKRLLAEEERRAAQPGFAEAAMPFADQHRIWGEKEIAEVEGERPRRVRYNLAESPLAMLARRKDKDGQPFLSADLVAAGERLREDFELAQLGPRVAQNWDRFLTAGDRGAFAPGGPAGGGSGRARERVA